jgi:hypothetical protein
MTEPVDVATYNRMHQIGRENWSLPWRIADLLPHVRAAHAHHTERVTWWEAERVKAERLVRSSLKLRQQQHTGGTHTEAVLDPTRQVRLTECEAKVASHRARVDELGTWLLALDHTDKHNHGAGRAESTVTLTIADLRFFELGEHD